MTEKREGYLRKPDEFFQASWSLLEQCVRMGYTVRDTHVHGLNLLNSLS